MKTLETPRLLLRPFTLEDAEDAYREIYSDVEVVQHYSRLGVQTLEQVRTRIASFMGAWASDDLGRHAVILKESQAFIGQVHLNGYVNSFARWNDEPDPPFNPLEVELAFAFGRRFWGKVTPSRRARLSSAMLSTIYASGGWWAGRFQQMSGRLTSNGAWASALSPVSILLLPGT
jgi:RimJ/RimL family protein N-acetyltransferase